MSPTSYQTAPPRKLIITVHLRSGQTESDFCSLSALSLTHMQGVSGKSLRVKSKTIKSGNAEEAEASSASSAFRVYGLNSGFTCGSTGGPICVGSKAVWLLRSPPPETVAVLTTFAVMFCGTSTVRVIGG